MTKQILIIEDDPGLADLYRRELAKLGIEAALTADGEAGLDQALTKPFDLILVDLMLPKMDGLTILEQIRHEPKVKTVPIVMLSNLAEDSTVQQALKLGVNGYLVKSQYSPEQVAAEVLKYLS